MTSSYRLTNFPPEILQHICSMFCFHCSYGTVKWYHYQGERPQCVQALYNLSLTCRALRAMAQPILYHEPHTTKSDLGRMLTFVARPDLAAEVRDIMLCTEGDAPDPSEEELAVIRAAAARLGASLPDPLEEDFTIRFLELLLLLVPNVEKVSYVLSYSEEEEPSNVISETGAVLKSLRHLHLSHWDTEGGFCLNAVDYLLNAAPNLEFLTLHMCKGVKSGLFLEKVRSLRFTSSLFEWPDIFNIITACPQLERFTYKSGASDVDVNAADDEVIPSHLMQVLQTRKATLKHLDLDFGEYYLEIRDESMVEEELFGSFADFPVLETLIVRLEHLFEQDRIEAFYNSEELVEKLPKSLRFLGLEGELRLFEEPVALAAAVEQGTLPNLKRVVLAARNGETARLKDSFAAVGVEYEKYDPDSHGLARESWLFF